MAGGTFKPCWKCDYLFNHTSGKVSGGMEGEALRLKKMKYGNSVKAVISQCRFVAAFFCFRSAYREQEGDKCGIITGCQEGNGA